jgi:hypothetical protein
MLRRRNVLTAALFCSVLLLKPAPGAAGPIFLTGHDPDFHAQGSVGAQNLLRTGLQFVTNNTYNSGMKFLWVESFLSPTSGHLVGENGLNALGLTLGIEYDWVDAAGFAAADLSTYDAIAVASSFGGMLTQAELDALIARSTDIEAFVNAGRGVLALSECFPASSFCFADTLGPSPDLFGFLPVTVSSVGTLQGYTVTPFGAGLGLTNGDVNDPTHNSFGVIAGLNIVDTDSQGTPTTLAGVVRIDDGEFTPVPEPTSMFLLGTGLVGLAARYRRTRS